MFHLSIVLFLIVMTIFNDLYPKLGRRQQAIYGNRMTEWLYNIMAQSYAGLIPLLIRLLYNLHILIWLAKAHFYIIWLVIVLILDISTTLDIAISLTATLDNCSFKSSNAQGIYFSEKACH